MKIVGVDNYDREIYDDILVCENVKNKYYGNKIVDMLNRQAENGGETFYKLVEDDYKLFVFEL